MSSITNVIYALMVINTHNILLITGECSQSIYKMINKSKLNPVEIEIVFGPEDKEISIKQVNASSAERCEIPPVY